MTTIKTTKKPGKLVKLLAWAIMLGLLIGVPFAFSYLTGFSMPLPVRFAP